MFKSIKWRLTLTYLILIFISLTAMGTFLLRAMDHYYVREIEENLLAHARVLSHYAELTFLGNDLARQFGKDVEARVQILDDRGRVVGDSLWPEAPIGEPLEHPGVEEALAGDVRSGIKEPSPGGERLLHVAAPLRSDPDIIGAVYLSTSLARVDETLAVARNLLFLGTGIALVISLLVGLYLARTVTGPIREIAQATTEVAGGKYAKRLIPRGQDELAQLAVTFNHLTERLEVTIGEISGERKKLATVMASMGDGLVAVDREGRGLLLNPAAEEIFGLKGEKVLGFPLPEALAYPRLEEILKEVLAEGRPLVDEMQLPPSSPTVYRVQVSPIRAPGEDIVGAVAVLRDVSDLRRLEQMRLQFLSNVSHELRTPLTSIKGFAVTLADDLPPEGPTRHYAEVIEQETDRLARLVDDLLNLSRMDALQVTMEPVSIDPARLVEECLNQLSHRARRSGITLRGHVAPGLPRFPCDPDRMKQVLINLLDNALKFTPAGGTITVKVWAAGEHLHISITDTGIGIPAPDLPRIFDRFYRVDVPHSHTMGGTGLGLSIVKMLVEGHQGTIDVQSRSGEGTEFLIKLPRGTEDPYPLQE